jgi:hypothetical protein
MQTRGGLLIDPGSLETHGPGEAVEIVVPYTEWAVTESVLKRATAMAPGLNITISLIAVHVVPYAASFGCPAAVHAHLVEQLVDLAGNCPLPVKPQVVLARGREEGFEFVMKPESTVLIGTRRHFWRTAEEKLAHALARAGHKVALLYVN